MNLPIDLFEKTVAKTLTESERDELEKLVLEDASVRRAYIEYLDLHGALYWESSEASREPFSIVESSGGTAVSRTRKVNGLGSAILKIAASIALLAGGIWLGNGLLGKSEPVIAVLESAENCRWSSGSLPTNSGAELTNGTLFLTEGLATIVFSSGAKVQLEGPAELELVDAMHCKLKSGTLVANVPEPAQGFTVDTQTAELIDYGTEFGVSVDGQTGETQLEVFTGAVDIAQRESGKVERLTTGQKSRVGGDFFEIGDSQDEESTRFGGDASAREGEILVPASADTYIAGPKTDSHSSETLLLIKTPLAPSTSFSRKIYLKFDLGEKDFSSASLELWLRRSGFGYASFVDDAVFKVYGLRADREWNRDTLQWRNAPGNDVLSNSSVMEEETIALGEFAVPQGVDSGKIEFSTPELTDYLSSKRAPATLIIVRETVESRGGGIVHAFASSRDPAGGTPRLRLSQ